MFTILNAYYVWLALSQHYQNPDQPPPPNNNRPIIGIISQDLDDGWDKIFVGENYTTYIPATYIKYIEMAGARVIPIIAYQTDEYYEYIFSSINGVLFPGGTQILETSGYGVTAQKLWKLALKANQLGDYFPIWGTCLGFEMIMFMASEEVEWRTWCQSDDEAAPLELTNEIWKSRMLGDMNYWMTVFLSRENTSVNFHHWCYTLEDFKKSGLEKFFRLLSTNKDQRGEEFVSTVEAFNYPFYGVQWHPEKNGYEWAETEPNIPHGVDAIEVMQYFANFFVQEARRNAHKFPSEKEESDALIYNVNPIYTRPLNITSEQIYAFRDGEMIPDRFKS